MDLLATPVLEGASPLLLELSPRAGTPIAPCLLASKLSNSARAARPQTLADGHRVLYYVSGA